MDLSVGIASYQRGVEVLCGPFPLGWAVLLGVLALLLGGCTRTFYRKQADREVYELVGEKSCDPRWSLQDYTIQPDPRSRLFDPFNPDRSPMPPDDPTAHALMQRVYGMRGWRGWDRKGQTAAVDNGWWTQHLPCDAQGQVTLNRDGAVEMALLQSREYQRALETLYLSALDVSYERFRFDVQFFLTNATRYSVDSRISGPNPTTRSLASDSSLQAKKLFATGAQLVTELANSILWQFGGADEGMVTSLARFSLAQPLLRAGGRAVVLEALTDSERGLVANVRQMEHFRRGFYARIVAGRDAGTGPVRSGLAIGTLAPGSSSTAGGFLRLLGDQVRIRNQRANMVAIQDSWRRLDALNQAGRVRQFQVDLTLQSLYQSQSSLLSLINAYEDRLESYKITLGLPPDVPVQISDPLVSRFDLIDPALTAVQDSVNALLGKVRDPKQPLPADLADQVAAILQQSGGQLASVESDVQTLNEALPERDADLRRLSGRPELQRGDVDASAYSAQMLNRRVHAVNQESAALAPTVRHATGALDLWLKGQPAQPATARQNLLELLTQLANRLAQLSLIQARARLDSIRLVPVELDPREAFDTAGEHRLDWMNARAALVDVWRKIEVRANALQAGLDFTVNGELRNHSQSGTRGQIQVGMAFDAPLTRLAERNAYRESLISYQQARRDYLLFVDRLYQGLRTTLRTMRTNQLDFELRRAAVFLAISQVDVAMLRIEEPPRPGQDSQLGDTAARDILDSLSALLSAQNNLLGAWLDYESQRISLDFDLGTMELDGRGIWVDPGPIVPSDQQSEEIPPPTPQPR